MNPRSNVFFHWVFLFMNFFFSFLPRVNEWHFWNVTKCKRKSQCANYSFPALVYFHDHNIVPQAQVHKNQIANETSEPTVTISFLILLLLLNTSLIFVLLKIALYFLLLHSFFFSWQMICLMFCENGSAKLGKTRNTSSSLISFNGGILDPTSSFPIFGVVVFGVAAALLLDSWIGKDSSFDEVSFEFLTQKLLGPVDIVPPPETRGSRGTSISVPKRLSLSTSLKPGLKHSLGIQFSLRILSESCTTRLSASVSVTTWKSGKVFWELCRSFERSSYWTKQNVFLNHPFLKPRFLSLEKSFVLILRNVSLSELNLMYLLISPRT